MMYSVFAPPLAPVVLVCAAAELATRAPTSALTKITADRSAPRPTDVCRFILNIPLVRAVEAPCARMTIPRVRRVHTRWARSDPLDARRTDVARTSGSMPLSRGVHETAEERFGDDRRDGALLRPVRPRHLRRP